MLPAAANSGLQEPDHDLSVVQQVQKGSQQRRHHGTANREAARYVGSFACHRMLGARSKAAPRDETAAATASSLLKK
jgi:hypothetical protein